MRAPKENKKRHVPANPRKGGLFVLAMRFFQGYISRVDGSRCSMYPTCSQYDAEAFSRHGAVKGMMMTVDRLFHEWSETKFAKKVVVHGVVRYWDPVRNNDFWFSARRPLTLDDVEEGW